MSHPAARIRPLVRVMIACAVATAITAVALRIAAPAYASSAGSPRLAVLVLAPYLTFDDLSPTETPALWRLAETGAVGAMNARTADQGQPNAASGALTISASRWASVPSDARATAHDIAELQAINSGTLTRPVLGSLGGAVRSSGGRTAVIEIGESQDAVLPRRPGELAAMDSRGLVDVASASSSTLADLTSGKRDVLLVLDSPALTLAGESSTMTASQRSAAHEAAVAELDAAVAAVLQRAPEDTSWLVVSPSTAKRPYEDPVMGPVIVSGSGLSGELTSSSTRRRGIVTSLDVAPTLLGALGLKRPEVMIGTTMSARPDPRPLAERLSTLAAADRTAGAVDRLREAWFIRGFVAFALLAVALCVWVIERRRPPGSASGALLERATLPLALTLCSVPVAAWLMFLVSPHPASVVDAAVAFALAILLVLAALLGMSRLQRATHPRREALAAPLLATALLTAVILVEQWLGAPMRSGLLSYSVRSGWRFYGLGNEGAAILVAASIVGVGLATELLGGSRGGVAVRRYALPIVGAVVLVTAAGPFAGANAGVAVWGVVAYAVAWAAMNGVRLNARTVALIGSAIALAIVAFGAVDLARGAAGGTHLARFIGGIVAGDGSSTAEMVGRKLANNLGYFVATAYTLLFFGMAAVFAVIRPGSRSSLHMLLEPFPALRAALLGVFVGGLLALVSEDSSSVMPALMWVTAIAPTLAVVLVARNSRISS